MNNRFPAMRILLGLCLLLPVSAQTAVFSIVVIPDTQMYAERHPEIFEAQMDWVVANEVAENIIYVAHLGDIKDDGLCDSKTVNLGTGAGRSEWQIVDQAIDKLDTANIPYGLAAGNHDFDQFAGGCPNYTTQRPLSNYNLWFGPNRYLGDAHYGDPSVPTAGNRVVNSNEDNFTLFESSGVKFIAINLAYKQAANALGSDPEVTWADNLLKAYPDRIGIVTSHFFMQNNTERTLGGPKNILSAYGQEVYDGLSNNQNLFLMMSAHRFGEAWRVENTGRLGAWPPTQILLADYQAVVYPSGPNPELADFGNLNGSGTFGDSGLMRIMRFDTTTGMVDVETFIPPVVPIKARPNKIVSTYFPANGAGMDKDTASNFSFSYQGYVPDLACDGINDPPVVVENSANRFELTFKNDDQLSFFPVGATGGRELEIFTGGESASIAISVIFRDSVGGLEDLIFIFESIAGDEFFPDPSNQAGDVLIYSNSNGFAGADAVNPGDGLMPGFANTELTVTVGVSRDDPFCARLVLSD